MSFHPDDFLADGLDTFAGIWEADFREYWGLDDAECPPQLSEDEWTGAKILYSVAEAFHNATFRLQPSPAGIHRVISILKEVTGEDPRDSALVNQSLDIILGRFAGDVVSDQRRRAVKLLDVLVDTHSERTREYLVRLARCYLFGMDPEGAVMARAVLDTALQDIVDDREVLSKGNASHPRRVDLHDRLRHLKREGLLTRDAWEAADSIRQIGNDAVHLAPGTVEDLDVIFGKLRLVFDELEERPKPD